MLKQLHYNIPRGLKIRLARANIDCTSMYFKPSKHLSWWRRTEDVFSVTFFCLPRRLEDIISRRLANTPRRRLGRRLEDVLKMSWRRLARRLEDVLKTSSRHFRKTYYKYVFKTSWKTKSVTLKPSSRRLEDVLENKKCLLGIWKWDLPDLLRHPICNPISSVFVGCTVSALIYL